MYFRVNKTKDFTVMSNYHLRDKNLSLKAKGLLSVLLSLPDDWNYSLNGIVAICKESKDAVTNAINELKENEYVKVTRTNTKRGFVYNYDIYEIPQRENPYMDSQHMESPSMDNPYMGSPCMGNPTQLNTNILNTKELNTKKEKKKKEKETANASSPLSLFVNDVIDYLNSKCNTHYKATTPKTRKLVEARKKEGFTLEDFKTVIDNKYTEWYGNEKMEMYLRPETLFGTKFESYLNQKPTHYENSYNNNFNHNKINNEKEYVNSNASDIDLDELFNNLDFEGCNGLEEKEKMLNEQ